MTSKFHLIQRMNEGTKRFVEEIKKTRRQAMKCNNFFCISHTNDVSWDTRCLIDTTLGEVSKNCHQRKAFNRFKKEARPSHLIYIDETFDEIVDKFKKELEASNGL